MNRTLQIGLPNLGIVNLGIVSLGIVSLGMGILFGDLSASAARISISDQESNDNVAQVVSPFNDSVLIGDGSTQMKVWADRNGDRTVVGDELILDLSSKQIGRKTLPAGAYIVEVSKASALTTPSNYTVEILYQHTASLQSPKKGVLVRPLIQP
jgi:hypothetical protein